MLLGQSPHLLGATTLSYALKCCAKRRSVAKRTWRLDHHATHLMVVELKGCGIGTIVRCKLLIGNLEVYATIDIILVELAHNERLTIALNKALDILLVRRQHLLGAAHLKSAKHPVLDIHTRECDAIDPRKSRGHIASNIGTQEYRAIDLSNHINLVVIARKSYARRAGGSERNNGYG